MRRKREFWETNYAIHVMFHVKSHTAYCICFIVENGENIGRYFEHYYEGIRQTIAFSAKENTKIVI